MPVFTIIIIFFTIIPYHRPKRSGASFDARVNTTFTELTNRWQRSDEHTRQPPV
jgi:hypothetical protein